MPYKNILITGAEGFIARNLAINLNRKKLTIFGIGTKKFTRKISHKFGYKFLLNKNINISNLKKNFKNIDLILHCAGSGVVGLSDKGHYKKKLFNNKSYFRF